MESSTQKVEIPEWPHVYGGPSGTGKIRVLPTDFIVKEHLAFEPSGEGEHAFLQIQKTSENTEFVARQLARFANVRQRDVSFAGLKDRHAVTTQWFSVWLPGKADPDWTLFQTDTIKVRQVIRHARKLKRGVLSGNSFTLQIKEWQGEEQKTLQQLEAIKLNGVANYFGSQRFGHNGLNVQKALEMFEGAKVGREQRSIYLSAARSFLFNQILAYRVTQQIWNQAVSGDTYIFDGSHSSFKSDQPDADIIRRLNANEIHPSGALTGKGNESVSGYALQLENAIIQAYPLLSKGLVTAGVENDRRALRVNVKDLHWQFLPENVLELSFTLPAGAYATTVLRELIHFE